MTLPLPTAAQSATGCSWGLRANGASLEVTLAFNLFRFSTSDTLYLQSQVTLCDKRAGRPCPPVSRQTALEGPGSRCSLRRPQLRVAS